MRSSVNFNDNIKTALEEFEHSSFKEGTPITLYGFRKIELCRYLQKCGKQISEHYLFEKILQTLPPCWDQAKEKIFQKHNPTCGEKLVELLEEEEREFHPLWIEFEQHKMSPNLNVRDHMHNKERVYNILKRRGFCPNIIVLVHAIVSTLPPTWPISSIIKRIKCGWLNMRDLADFLEEIERY